MAEDTSGNGSTGAPRDGRSAPENGEPSAGGSYGRREPSPRPGGSCPPPNGFRYGSGGPYRGAPVPIDSRAFCILSYLGVLWIVGLLVARADARVRYHVNQGIILSIFEFALGLCAFVVKSFNSLVFIRLFSFVPVLPQLGMAVNSLLSFALGFLTVIFVVIGVLHAAQDRQEPLPVIGTLFTVIS